MLKTEKLCPRKKNSWGIYTNIALDTMNFLRFADVLESSTLHCIRWISFFTRLHRMAVITNRMQLTSTCRPAGNRKNKKWFLQFTLPETHQSQYNFPDKYYFLKLTIEEAGYFSNWRIPIIRKKFIFLSIQCKNGPSQWHSPRICRIIQKLSLIAPIVPHDEWRAKRPVMWMEFVLEMLANEKTIKRCPEENTIFHEKTYWFHIFVDIHLREWYWNSIAWYDKYRTSCLKKHQSLRAAF